MNARRISAASPLTRVLVALVALTLSLFTLGTGAPMALASAADRCHMEIGALSTYDGQPQAATVKIVGEHPEGYTVEYYDMDNNLLPEAPTRTDAGTSEKYWAYLINPQGVIEDVQTFQIEIQPRIVTANISGASASCTYDGQQQVVEGYTLVSADVQQIDGLATPAYTEADFSLLSGMTAKAAGTNVGNYSMLLTELDFVNNNDNFKVTFNVTDGVLTIAPRAVTVSIEGSTEYTFYNGGQQSIGGYTLSGIVVEEIEGLATPEYTAADFDFADPEYAPVASGFDVGTYYMGMSAESFVNKNANFTVEFDVTDGFESIAALPVLVRVEGNIDVVQYNGTEQTVEGFKVTAVTPIVPEDGETDGAAPSEENEIYPIFDVNSVKTHSLVAVAKGTDAGVYPMGLTEEEFYCDDTNYACEFKVVDGGLRIEAREGVVLTVTGNTATYDYDGAAKTVEGYTAVSSDPLFTEADWYFDGSASVTAAEAGTYAMGLAADQFSVASKNFANVKFVVTDGQLTINAPADKGNTDKGSTDKGSAIPKTGDDTNLVLPIVAGVAGVVVVGAGVALIVVRRKQRG